MTLINTDDMFDSVTQYAATIAVLERERVAADYIDNTTRRRLELDRLAQQLDIARRTPIRHDRSATCPTFPGRPVFVIHALNRVILRAPWPERINWTDVVGWNWE